MRRVGWRLMPFLMACYFIAYIDRVNIGVAALDMKELGLSAGAFGLGGTMFFIAYTVFEIPSNLVLQRTGARLWIARIMMSWGVVGLASCLVVGPRSFFLARFFLGAAEAGFFPGVILYLTYWFPPSYRARIIAMFMVAIPLSNFFGSPVSTLLLELNGVAGLHGWQWVFIGESVPAIVLGALALLLLTSRPAKAFWLTAPQRDWLEAELANDRLREPEGAHVSVWSIVRNKYVWLLALVYCGSSATSNALSLWQPQILKSFQLTNLQVGLANMIPFGFAAVFMIFWGRYADVTRERIWSTALPLAVTCVSLLLTSATSSLGITLLLLSLALIGIYAINGPFWALVAETLPPSLVAASIAAINTLAHVGTGGASALIGIVKQQTGSFALALLPLALLTALGSGAILWIGAQRRKLKAV